MDSAKRPAQEQSTTQASTVIPLPVTRATAARHAQRLAFLLPNLGGGGVQKNTLTIAKGLASLGFSIDLLLCSESGPLHCQVPEEFNIIRLPGNRQWAARCKAFSAGDSYWGALLQPVLMARKPSKTLRYLPALSDYLRTARPAALLSATVHLNIEAVLAKAISGAHTRIIATQSHQFSNWHQVSGEWRRRHVRSLARKAYLAADGIVAVSRGVASDLADYLDLPAELIEVIYNPVVTPELIDGREKPVDHPWFGAGEPPVILSVGRPGRQKDFVTLIRAFARVRERIPARLLILGEARDPNKKQRRKSELLTLASDLGVNEFMDFQGFVHNPYAYMSNAATFVLSSRYEGFGNVLAEALACGCPVVSTDCPSGPAEILHNGAYGTLVPVGDVAAMADAICASLQNPPQRAQLYRRSSEFELAPIAERYMHALLGT